VSYWRLCGPDGTNFGHRLWVEIVVPTTSEAPTNDVIATPVDEPDVNPQAAQPAGVFDVIDTTALANVAREILADPFATLAPIFGVQQPAPQSPTAPAPVVAQPVPEPAPAPAPVAPETTSVEAEILVTLREMGFNGDLLTTLRNHQYVLFLLTPFFSSHPLPNAVTNIILGET
jgi:hypothetical protein